MFPLNARRNAAVDDSKQEATRPAPSSSSTSMRIKNPPVRAVITDADGQI